MQEKYQLTPVEHELMEILWKLEQGTVRDVMSQLPRDRHLAYTSVSTILRILQQKKIIGAIKSGKQHIYQPLLSKEAYASHSVKKMVSQVFSGNSVNLVAYLVDKHGLSTEEIDAIQRLLAARKKELPDD
jgi:predicted transcriptional regulator